MNAYKNKIFLLSMGVAFIFAACTKEWKDAEGKGPEIIISDAFESIEGINVGDVVTIPVTVKDASGIRRLSYFFVVNTANGTESGVPVHIDPENFPTELTQEIKFTIQPNMAELVVVSFNKSNFASEQHITMSEIRKLPILSFKDNIKFMATVFANKNLKISGTVTSEHDLKSIYYTVEKDGVYGSQQSIAFTDKKNASFEAGVIMEEGITAVAFTALNIYDGMATDTFRIGDVAEDDVSLTLGGGNSEINVLYADSINVIDAIVLSGSEMESLSYAIKINGVYGEEIPVPLGDPLDEFTASIEIEGEAGTEAIRITGTNKGEKTKTLEVPVNKVYRRLLHFKDIVLTTEVGPGKNNWFSAFQAPHVFTAAEAVAHQEMLDLAFIKYTSGNRIVPGAVYAASAAYRNATAPYMTGFSSATYTMVTANRGSVNPTNFNNIYWDGQLVDFIKNKIIAPTSQGGENYNVTTTNRRVSADMIPGAGFIIGWGHWNFTDNVSVTNEVFGLVLCTGYEVNGDWATVTLQIKVPDENQRVKYNPTSIHPYP